MLSEEICKSDRPQQVIFTQRVQDYILSGPIVKTELVASDQECQMQCILSFKCDVFNLGPLDESFRRSCQILRYEIKNYTLQRQKGWSFRARKVKFFSVGLTFKNYKSRETLQIMRWTTDLEVWVGAVTLIMSFGCGVERTTLLLNSLSPHDDIYRCQKTVV